MIDTDKPKDNAHDENEIDTDEQVKMIESKIEVVDKNVNKDSNEQGSSRQDDKHPLRP
jgi:hypothetical protein